MTARDLFFAGGTGGRLRAPWRLVGFALVAGLVLPVAMTALGLARPSTAVGSMTVFSGAAVLALAAAHFVMVRVVDDLPWRAVWLDAAAAGPRPLGWGMAVGAAAIAVPGAALLSAGWLELVGAPGTAGDAVRYGVLMLAVLLPAAVWEELLFRGYLLRVLRDAIGAWPAVLITGAAFGVAHVGNLASAPLLALVLVTLAGVLLGWIVLARRSLYAAIAAHLAWNAVLVAGLHTEVSGAQLGAPPAYRVVDAGPDWATGGPWGPEGGLAAGAGLTAALLITLSRRESREER
ncbi:MAG TPA: CPBP family intramembrane glutamic endopeptidase [Gemmatimonadaceae bacterium]|nr:CPBP family intramembrane glutamic endopeptidase [Gemmatimonadaceae bacterium]